MAPTRETAIEIHETLADLFWNEQVWPLVVYGGLSSNDQMKKFRRGCDILFATPRRSIDFVYRNDLALGAGQTLSLENLCHIGRGRYILRCELDSA